VPEKEIARKKIEDQFSINLEGKKLLLTVGRQVKRKGHAWFINEVYSHVNPDTYFLVIGDGPEHDLILQARENSDRKETIIIAGKQPDKTLKNAYSAADLFIMPNIPIKGDMEGFGIVLLEANLASTPAVASDLEGIKDVLTNGKNGYKVPVKDPKAFADRINQVLSEEVEDFGAKSRAYVRDKFAWTNVADEYVDYLQTVIDRYPK
jgi:phosphatidylinositol alpha-1,6-mannosyltransferase